MFSTTILVSALSAIVLPAVAVEMHQPGLLARRPIDPNSDLTRSTIFGTVAYLRARSLTSPADSWLFKRVGTCDPGFAPCTNQNGCCVEFGECCNSGGCCDPGYDCVTIQGQPGCCPTGETCTSISGSDCQDANYLPCTGENFCCPAGDTCFVDNSGDPQCQAGSSSTPPPNNSKQQSNSQQPSLISTPPQQSTPNIVNNNPPTSTTPTATNNGGTVFVTLNPGQTGTSKSGAMRRVAEGSAMLGLVGVVVVLFL